MGKREVVLLPLFPLLLYNFFFRSENRPGMPWCILEGHFLSSVQRNEGEKKNVNLHPLPWNSRRNENK